MQKPNAEGCTLHAITFLLSVAYAYMYCLRFRGCLRVALHDYIIRKTCPCNIYPFKPHFYIEKLGYAGVYLFVLFLLQNIDYGYPQSMFLAKIRKKKIIFFPVTISFVFTTIFWACFRNAPVICNHGPLGAGK